MSEPGQAELPPFWVQLLEVSVRMAGVPLGLWSLREAVRAASLSSVGSALMVPFFILFGLTIIAPWKWARSRDRMRVVCLTLTCSGSAVFIFGFYPAFRRVPVHGLEDFLGLVVLSAIFAVLFGNARLCWLELARRRGSNG